MTKNASEFVTLHQIVKAARENLNDNAWVDVRPTSERHPKSRPTARPQHRIVVLRSLRSCAMNFRYINILCVTWCTSRTPASTVDRATPPTTTSESMRARWYFWKRQLDDPVQPIE